MVSLETQPVLRCVETQALKAMGFVAIPMEEQ